MSDPVSTDTPEEFSLEFKPRKRKAKKPIPVDDAKTPAPDSEPDYTYVELLERLYSELKASGREQATDSAKKTIPVPQMIRSGTKHTLWSNFEDTATALGRPPDHLQQFITSELGTDASVDGMRRLNIKGRCLPTTMEKLVRKYIVEYVGCGTCRKLDTTLTRDPSTRLLFVQCALCGARRSVTPIKTGFRALAKGDRKKERVG